jgi:hypothetical protein
MIFVYLKVNECMKKIILVISICVNSIFNLVYM